MRLDLQGYPLWGTYYGGPGDDMAREIIVKNGIFYISGYAASSSGISTTGAHQSSYGGGGDGFIAKFDNLGCGANFYGKMVRPTLCQGDSTGIAAVIMSNTSSAPTFKWKTNPPQYNDTAFGLPSGVYEVVVSDTFGCLDSVKVTILSPIRVSAFVRDSVHISCNGRKDGILIADAVGGTQPYFFRWLTSPNVTDDSLTGLGVGTYKVLVTDNNNCRDSATARITEPEQLKSSITGFNNPTCFLLNNGQISVTATGGTQPYYYSWSTSPSQKSSTAYNITAGYYEVTVTDKNGCTSKSSYTLTEPSPITIGLTSLNHSLCFNDSLGKISTLVWGGTPGYKLEWNNNPSLDKNNLTKLRGGSYRLNVTDANNCTESRTFVINEPNPLVINFDSLFNPKCNGYADGRITASVGGGSPSYKLNWNTPPYNDVYRVTGLKAGLYILNVKDSFGCTLSDSVQLLNADSITVKATIVIPRCFDGKDGKITTEVKGGTFPYTFLWTHNPSLNTSQLNNIPAGNYYLNVKDKVGCNLDLQYLVNQPNKLEIIKQLQQDVTCYNGSNGALSVAVAGGTPPLQTKWSAGNPSDALSINNLRVGFYSITLTDSNGCADSASYQIKEPTPLLGYFDSIFSPSCYAYQNGNVTFKVTGGVRPYVYSFDNGPIQFDSVATFVKSGWIKVKVVDNNGCIILDSSLITQPAQLSFNPEVTNISCFSLQDGKIIVNGGGGIKPYKFSWSHMSVDTNIAYNLAPGVYVVTISDKNNCTWKDTVQIIQPEKLQAKVDLTVPASCYNVANGMATGTAIGGTPAYEFFWKGPLNYNGQSVNGMKAGNYLMYVKDKNGCLDSAALTIGQPNRVASSIKAIGIPSCVDSTDGWAEVTPLFGVGPFTYRWSNGSTDARANNLAKGTYSVIITDKCGDTAMAYVAIPDPAPFILPNITGTRASFRGNQDVYEMANVPGWTYVWEVSLGTIISGQGTSKITVLWDGPGEGQVQVKVYSGSGCYDDNAIQVFLTAECLYVLPNPSDLVTKVILPTAQSDELLQIFDARGRKVFESPASLQNDIDVSSFARGIYFIRYRNCVIKFLKS